MPRGAIHRATCPHCGMQSTAAALGRHMPVCLANPVNRERYRALLTAHDDVGVKCVEYKAKVADGAPAIATLQRMTGVKAWPDILAVFGLREANEVEAARVCPICSRTFKALGYARH